MKYLVTVETLVHQNYLVEAESEEEATEKALSGGEDSCGIADSEFGPQVINVEVYNP